MSERTRKRRRRRAQLLTPAARWLLTGELQRDMNPFEAGALSFALQQSERDKVRALLDEYGDMVPEARLPALEAIAGGKRGPSLLDADIEAHWRDHGFTYPDDGVPILERSGEAVRVVDGTPVRRPGIPSRWLNEWLRVGKF